MRVVFLLLALILPLQSVWSAAGAYCMHELETTSSHFGHHVHQHKPPVKSVHASGSSSAFHSDCATCHLPGGGAFTRDFAPRIESPGPYILVTESRSLQPIVLERPERPKWQAPA